MVAMKARVDLDNFSEDEVAGLSNEMKAKLQCLRYLAGVPIVITSALRPGDTGEHGEGLGIDISDNAEGKAISSRFRFHVSKAAYALGFRRIGTYDRHIHLGVSLSRDQDVAWQGVSE